MRDNKCFRPVRYFINEQYECWSMEIDSGEGYSPEDVVVIKLVDPIQVIVLTKENGRKESEAYTSSILALFEHIAVGEDSFDIKWICDEQLDEYEPDDLIELHRKQAWIF